MTLTTSPASRIRAIAALALSILAAGCTSEPLVSRQGISTVAVGEVGIEALFAMAAMGAQGGVSPPDHLGNFDTTDTIYLGGIVPFKKIDRDTRVDNGTRVFVDGRKRGFLPFVKTFPKPGPHVVRLEIPAFRPYALTLSHTIQFRIGDTCVEAWPPIIVDCLTGEIFTTNEHSSVNHDRNSGMRQRTDLAKKVGREPLLIVTTTDKRHPGWRKLGQLKSIWAGSGM